MMTPLRTASLAAVTLQLLAAPVSAQTGATVTFQRAPDAVGDVRSDESTLGMSLDMEVRVDGELVQSASMSEQESKAKKRTVLEVTDGIATKVRLAFGTMKKKGVQAGTERELTLPVSGRVYVAARGKDDRIEVTSGDEKPVSTQEAEIVRNEAKRLGKPDRLASFLPDRPVAVGESLEVPLEVLREMFDDEKVKSDRARFTLKGVEEGRAIFAMDLKLKGEPNPGVTMRMNLTGELLIDPATKRALSLKLDGPVTLESRQKNGESEIRMDGKGTFSADMRMTYGE